MPRGMVIKSQPPVRDRHNKRILLHKVGDFTDAMYKKLLKGGQIAPAGASPEPAKQSGESKDGAGTDKDQTNAGSGTEPAGNASSAGGGTSL